MVILRNILIIRRITKWVTSQFFLFSVFKFQFLNINFKSGSKTPTFFNVEFIVTGAAILRFSAKLIFLIYRLNSMHLLKSFGKSLKSNCQEELWFSLSFLIFRHGQVLQTSSRIQQEDDKWRRQMISKEIRRKEAVFTRSSL